MNGENTKHGIAITFPDGKEYCFLLNAAKATIGRGKENHIVIPCETVSTAHCELRAKGKSRSCFEIVDLNSTNGTSLNAEELPGEDAREVRNGDTLMIGLDVKARIFQLQEISDNSPKKAATSSIEAVSGAVTVRLQELHKPKPRSQPSINPVAAAVARASESDAGKR